MCADIVDNRRHSVSSENRKRYIAREKLRVARAVRHKLKQIGIKDLQSGKDVDVEVAKDYSEDSISIDVSRGDHTVIGTGNDRYETNDQWDMEEGGGRGTDGSPEDADEDANFNFRMTAEEFMDIFFDEYSLTYLPKQVQLEHADEVEYRQAGFISDGPPARLSVIRTFKNSLGRIMAETQDYLDQKDKTDDEEELARLDEKLKNIPLFRDVDLRFINKVPEPTIQHKCVMFCIMDVSGSMQEQQRYLAKQFFLLVFIFLQRRYKKIDIVFIRHTTNAEEVDEQTFFYDDKTGGTVMSTALIMMDEIIKQRYDMNIWNSYAIHVSDGGNWSTDDKVCHDIMVNSLLPVLTSFVYLETPDEYYTREMVMGSAIMGVMQGLKAKHPNMGTYVVRTNNDIWSAFVGIFQRKADNAKV